MPSRRELANAIRFLSMDAVQKANSGHPGMPMGMADIAEVLWREFLQHHPENPHWPNRDRFVLSNGHGCMLLYSLLHLTGYQLSSSDLQQFRQLHSKTPGHPEYGHTPGVEMTTGPLGQGLAAAVGLAIAEKHLASVYNRPHFPLINHYTYVFAGDGCLMEGISHEACSLAGTLKLGKLIVFYDDNGISIDGATPGWFTDNTPLRFQAYGWQVIADVDGHDSEMIKQAILAAQADSHRPTLICCKTVIAWGAPTLAGSAESHGAPLGATEIAKLREKLHWPYPPFEIPQAYQEAWDARAKGKTLEIAWQQLLKAYTDAYPELAAEFKRRLARTLPATWSADMQCFIEALQQKRETMATRKASGICLDQFAPQLPEIIGGSADLSGSNCTEWHGATLLAADTPAGRYIRYGVREFAMTAIQNGLALYGGLIPFGGTFLTFSDYARNAVRLAALMQTHTIFVYTHDSIGLGEDGPTHQPIEHAPSLRLIPGLSVWRPADSVETAVAWHMAITSGKPTCLLLTRQNVPCQARSQEMLTEVSKGGYILVEPPGLPEAIAIATGSEVALAVEAATVLNQNGRRVRVVSMPSTDVFLAQPESYREKILPSKIDKRLAIEAAAGDGWYRFVGCQGKVLGIDRFGASAPAKAVYQDCGLTVERVIEELTALLSGNRQQAALLA